MQPSSVDLHVDRYFRVFRNDTTPVHRPEAAAGGPDRTRRGQGRGRVHPPPGRVRPRIDLRAGRPGDDLVARLGRQIVAWEARPPDSLEPAGERAGDGARSTAARARPIGEMVAKRFPAFVVALRPRHVRGRLPRDHRLVRGPGGSDLRSACSRPGDGPVTAGHNLFTLDRTACSTKTRTGELRPGVRVAIPRRIPTPPRSAPRFELVERCATGERERAHRARDLGRRAFRARSAEFEPQLRDDGDSHLGYYCVALPICPLEVAASADSMDGLDPQIESVRSGSPSGAPLSRLCRDSRGFSASTLLRAPGVVTVHDLGHRPGVPRSRRAVILDRWVFPCFAARGAITAVRRYLRELFDWLGIGGRAQSKRIPPLCSVAVTAARVVLRRNGRRRRLP